MHIRFDFDKMMLGAAEHAEQLDFGAFQPGIAFTVGQCHLAPVDDALHPDAILPGMNQVSDEIGDRRCNRR